MISIKPIQESHGYLYIVCIAGFVIMNTAALLMVALSDIKIVHVDDTTKWWDILKVSLGAIMGYLFAGNTDKRNLRTI